MFRFALIALFGLIVVALFSSLWFMMRDPAGSRRMANGLMVRVIISAILVLLILFGFLSGQLHTHAPW
jgi:uncharacterized membrane protein